MEHTKLTISEVPTVPAHEIQVGRELRNGKIVKQVSKHNGGGITLHLSDGTMPLYYYDDPVPVAEFLPVTQTGTIDISPMGMTSPEGRKRVAEAQAEWDSATHHLANELRECIDAIFDRDTSKVYKAELYSQLQTLIGVRDRKQEAFLRAVAGK